MDTKPAKVSPRAREAYRAIETLTAARKPVLPNQTDVAAKLKLSNERARQLCQELKGAGLVTWIPNTEHTLHVIAPLPPDTTPARRKKRAAQKG